MGTALADVHLSEIQEKFIQRLHQVENRINCTCVGRFCVKPGKCSSTRTTRVAGKSERGTKKTTFFARE